MKQYLLARDDVDGENRDMFVTAGSPEEAVALVEAHWAEEADLKADDYEDAAWKVFEVPAARAAPGVTPWNDVVQIEADAPAPGPRG